MLQLDRFIRSQNEIDQGSYDLAVLSQKFFRLVKAQFAAARSQLHKVRIGREPVEFLREKTLRSG